MFSLILEGAVISASSTFVVIVRLFQDFSILSFKKKVEQLWSDHEK